jgi:two-component system sporulation sensor kinase B
MFVVVVAEWLIGIIILVISGKKDYARWISYTAFCAGLGGFSVILFENIRPYIKENIIDNLLLDDFLTLTSHYFSFIAQNVAPFTYLMFGICYCGFFSKVVQRNLSFILFTPVIIMFIISPIHPIFELSHVIMTTWVAPYVLFSNFLLICTIIKESNSILKRGHFFTAVIMIPPTLFSLLTNYFLRSFGIEDTWDDRNGPMADKIEIYLNDTTPSIYFVVVGAGHMVGDTGIIKQLQEKGFTITRQ